MINFDFKRTTENTHFMRLFSRRLISSEFFSNYFVTPVAYTKVSITACITFLLFSGLSCGQGRLKISCAHVRCATGAVTTTPYNNIIYYLHMNIRT